MIIKTLFRQYDPNGNTISGTQGSAVIAGTGTKFTEIPKYTHIEVEGIGFIGMVESVESDLSMTLDRPVNESFAGKVFWQDWSPWRISSSAANRRIESENEGEAGVFVFDDVSMQYYFGESLVIDSKTVENPVRKAFEGNITSSKKFLIRLQAVKYDFLPEPVALVTNAYQNIVDNLGNYISASFKFPQSLTYYEGLVDFSTKKNPSFVDESGEFIVEVDFDALDKLSALSLLGNNVTQRGTLRSAWEGIPGSYDSTNCNCAIKNYSGTQYGNIVTITTVQGNTGVPHATPILQKGETLVIWDVETQTEHVHLVLDSGLINAFEVSPTWQTTWVKLYPSDVSYQGIYGDYTSPKALTYYEKKYYGAEDICLYKVDSYGRTVVDAFNAVGIIKAMIDIFWPDITDELTEVLELPYNYFDQMIDEFPLGKEPLDALVFLAYTLNSYIFISRLNKLVIKAKASLDTSNPALDKEIPLEYLSPPQKRDFWDKLKDTATIEVNSWIKDAVDDNEDPFFMTGVGSASKRPGMKPRNELKQSIFIDKASLEAYGMSIDANGKLHDPEIEGDDQQAILDKYGSLKAVEKLDFYGMQHIAYNMSMCKLTWDMLLWDMLDTFAFVQQKEFLGDANNGRYFTTNLSIDPDEDSLEFDLISISRKDYDESIVLIGKQDDSYTSGSIGSSGSTTAEYRLWTGENLLLNPARGRQSLELDKDHAPEFGSLRLRSKVITSDYLLTIKENILLCDCTAGNITVTLPPETAINNIEYIIQKVDASANKITISGTVNDQVNPELLHKYEDIKIKKCGSKWVRVGASHNIRTFTNTPVGNLTPAFFGEEVVEPESKQWFKSYGFNNDEWVPITIRDGMDMVLEPGSSDGKVLVKQPGTVKSANKFLAIWHDGANAFIKVLTGSIVSVSKWIFRASADNDGTKQLEISHDGTDAIIEPKTGKIKTNNKGMDLGTALFECDRMQAKGTGDNHVLGRFGIGIEPNYPLHIERENPGDYIAKFQNNDSLDGRGMWVYVSNSSGPVFILQNTLGQHFRVDGNGSVSMPYSLQPSKIVETDAGNKLISAAKNTAYNKNFGTNAGEVAQGNHGHSGAFISNDAYSLYKFGIGLSPDYPLHVQRDYSGDYLAYFYNANATDGRGLYVGTANTSGPVLIVANPLGQHLRVDGDGSVSMPYSLSASKIVETNADGKLTGADKNSAYNKNFGTQEGTVCQGNDSRLKDFHEQEDSPSARVGEMWLKPSTGIVSVLTNWGWKPLN